LQGRKITEQVEESRTVGGIWRSRFMLSESALNWQQRLW